MFNEIEFRNRGKELFEKYGDARNNFIVSYEDKEALAYYSKLQPLFDSMTNDKEITLEEVKNECIRQRPGHKGFLNKVIREGLVKSPYVLSQYLTMIALFKAFGANGATSTRNRYGRKYPTLYEEITTLATKDFIRLNYIISTVKIN